MNKRTLSAASTIAHPQHKSPVSPTPLKGTPPATVTLDLQHLTPAGVLQLQRTLGNRAVGNLLRRMEGPPPTTAPSSTAQPPIQRVFTYIGNHITPGKQPTQEGEQATPPITSWAWVDSDTNTVYIWKPGLKLGPFIENTKTPSIVMVMRTDGFTLFIEPTDKEGKIWKVAGNEDPELQQIRLNPGSYEKVKKQPRPTLTPSDNMDLKMEEEEPPTTTFTQGAPKDLTYVEQSNEQLKAKEFHSMRMDHTLTTQMHMIPLKQGKATGTDNNNSNEPSDYVYPAASVGVATVLVGDTDRVDVGTHLDPVKQGGATPQGKHTVAWALVRRSIMGLAGRTVADVLDHFKGALALLKPMTTESPEAQFHWNRINYPSGLEQLTGAELPLDKWQSLVSEIVYVYTQLYHLSQGALFKGSSTNRKESQAVSMLGANETSLSQSNGLMNSKSELQQSAIALLELNLSLPMRTYAFAAHHWVETLVLTYPRVMKECGKALTDPFLNTSINGNEVPTGVTNVRELIVFYKYTLPDFATTVLPFTLTGETTFSPFTIQEIKADFVANLSVMPTSKGQAMEYNINQGENSDKIQLRSYTVDDLVITKVSISDRDRPKTKFKGKGQKSHTVAWTLVRNDLMAYAQGPVRTLLTFLQRSFTHLLGDSGTQEGVKMAQHAITQLDNFDTKQWALHDWQHYLSMMVKWYAHVSQQAKSASFADPRTHGRALSHGEAAHMAKLRRNEGALVNYRQLIDVPSEVVHAAIELFDLCVPKTKKVNLSLETNLMNAYDEWKELITHTFPEVMKVGWSSIFDELEKRDVGWENKDNLPLTKDMVNMGMGQKHLMKDILERNGRKK